MPCTLEGGGCSKGIREMGEVSVGATKEEVVGELKGIRG
jgi:hypothetical protein